MGQVTQEQLDRLNIMGLFNAHPLGSELQTSAGPGIVNGYRFFNGELRILAEVVTRDKTSVKAVRPLGVLLLEDPDNIEQVSKATNKAVTSLNEALPKVVTDKVAAAPQFEFSGQQLKAMRMAMNLTQVFVAEYLGMAKSSSAAIGDWEAERNKVPVKHQAKLIDLYTLSLIHI